MTQHEYVFVAVSIILGLAIARLLQAAGILIRVSRRVRFHWASAIWALCVMAYALQFWWVGWGLREIESWSFVDFLILIFGAICVFFAAEMSLPGDEGSGGADMLLHSQEMGRLSALSMLVYFLVGPYVNLVMYHNPVLAALIVPAIGVVITGLMVLRSSWFETLMPLFALYSIIILYLTA